MTKDGSDRSFAPDEGPRRTVRLDERLAGILRALPEYTFLLDEEGRYVEIESGGRGLLYERWDHLPGRTMHDVLPAPVADGALRHVRDALRTGAVQVFEYALDRPVGRRWYEGRCGPLEAGPDGARLVVWVARDVTQRKVTEEALRRSQARLHTVIESLPFGVWLLEGDGRYGLVNSTARDRWGADVIGLAPADVAPDPETLARWEANNARARSGEVLTSESTWQDGDRRRHLLSMLCPVEEPRGSDGDPASSAAAGPATTGDSDRAIMGLDIDVTEQRELAEQLQRAQRLESIGLLAGGIAHDFNNILTSIMGSVTLARLNAAAGADVGDLLTGAEKACLRARGLTQQLLTFSRGGAPIKEAGSIADVVRETAEFVLRGAAARASIALPDDLPPVEFDSAQMSQVFNNLLVNALQAMPDGGEVRVTARARDGWVEVVVSDDGVGISPEHLEQVFDPYFTTKTEGSGLGLATSYSIVRRHDGTMTIDSRPGEGTTVRIALPAAVGAPAPATGQAIEAESGEAGGGRILVMDDEPMVRESVASMLSYLGYEPALAASGEEALARYRAAREAGEAFDVVIMDLTIPGGMGGKDAAVALRAIDPDARLVASSGYSTDPVMADPQTYGFDAVVPKPFPLRDLDAVIRRLLDRRTPG